MTYIEKIIEVNLQDLLPSRDDEFDAILDMVSQKTVGNEVGLLDINFRPVGVKSDGTLLLRVEGELNEEDLSDEELAAIEKEYGIEIS